MDQDFECERRKQRRCEQIGANNPRCPNCAETDWRCFLATTMPRCANCAIKARTDPNNSEAKRRRLKKLGTTNPHCAMCGEGDWRYAAGLLIAGIKREFWRTDIGVMQQIGVVVDDLYGLAALDGDFTRVKFAPLLRDRIIRKSRSCQHSERGQAARDKSNGNRTASAQEFGL